MDTNARHPSVAEAAVAELIAVFADPALKARADQTPGAPEDAGAPGDTEPNTDSADATSTSETVDADQQPTTRPAPRRKPARRTSKRPALTLASNVTGDFAITAPPGTPKPPLPVATATEDNAPTQVLPGAGFDVTPPPLPSLSAEDAALKFEAMPEAPELHSTLDDQEPLRFAWAKRWPFLTLVPASEAPTRAQPEPELEIQPDPDPKPMREPESMAEAASWLEPQTVDATPEQASVDADPVNAVPVRPVAVLLAARSVGSGRPDTAVAEPEPEDADSAPAEPETVEPSAENAAEPESPVDAAGLPDTRADDTVVLAGVPVAAALAVQPRVAETAPVEPAAVDTVEPVIEPVDDEASDGTELLSDIAADVADDAPIVKVDPATSPVVLRITGLSRRFGDTVAVDGIDLDVHEGSFYGIVGPNGAGKTTTLSMITGLLRPDTGSITVHGVNVWDEPDAAKRSIGVLPDRLRLFDRLTGAQLLYYSGVLRGLDGATVRERIKDLARAFGLEDALNRLVTDYSAGMTKKVALAAAMIHSPRLLVLDEPFESVDPVSAANVIEILQRYVAHGGTVVLSSHGMDLIQRVCDHVAIIVHGKVLAAGAVDDVRGSGTLEERFVELAGGRKAAEGMEWLHSFSD
ncbi:MAG: ATP-binding cassette domain-containing protein [Mycetocola sp.]